MTSRRAGHAIRRSGSGSPFFRRSSVLAALVGAAAAISGPRSAGAVPQQGTGVAHREAAAVAHAERLERAGREDEALAVLEALLLEQPASVPGLVVYLRIAQQRGEAARVLPWAERAVSSATAVGPSARQVWIRALGSAGLTDSAASVARRWVASEPGERAAYAELAAIVGRTSGDSAAVRVFEQGRRTLGTRRLYVQELASLYETIGRYGDAAVEWKQMLSWGEAGVDAVVRSIEGLGEGRGPALEALRAELRTEATTVPQLRGAARLALALGQPDWSRSLQERLVAGLPPHAALRELADYVGVARDRGDLTGAAWAAAELARRSPSNESEYWNAIAADLSYEAGDEQAARRAFERVREAAQPGSDAHALALRRLHALALDGDPDGAQEILLEYRQLYPDDSDEGVSMLLRTAESWIGAGEVERGRSLLESEVPESATVAARRAALLGYLEILEGRTDDAARHMELAAAMPGSPETRIEAIRWLSALRSADPAELVRLGRGIRSVTEADTGPLTRDAMRWAEEDVEGGALLCALAAAELEARGFDREAARIRADLVRRWPGSPEAPGSMLELAREAARTDPDQAATWLERLIVEHPNSALAPVARRELAALQSAAAGAS